MRANRRYCIFMRELMRIALGYECQRCHITINLTFDLIIPRVGPKFHHGRMSWRQRMNYYWSQFLDSNLQLLCENCNPSKNCKGAAWKTPPDPF